MSDIIILRAALDALNGTDNQATGTRLSAGMTEPHKGAPQPEITTPGAPSPASALRLDAFQSRAGLISDRLPETAGPLGALADRNIYFDDELDSESVRLLALKAQQQLSIQALAIANVRALSIINLFRDDEPAIRLM